MISDYTCRHFVRVFFYTKDDRNIYSWIEIFLLKHPYPLVMSNRHIGGEKPVLRSAFKYIKLKCHDCLRSHGEHKIVHG